MNSTDQRLRIAEKIVSSLLIVMQFLLVTLWIFHEQLSLPGWIAWSGRLHPLLLHFPIVMLCLLCIAWLFRNSLGENLFRPDVFRGLLLFSAAMTSFTALSGYFLAGQGDYEESLLAKHRNLGTLTALLSYLMWIFFPLLDGKKQVVLPTLSLFTLLLGSHFGGSLTHGEAFLFAPDTETEQQSRKPITENSTVFEGMVEPILQERCAGCHNPQKAKGKLDLSSLAGIQKGGKSGAPWKPGDPLNSLMLQRILLDISDRKHMPPKGKAQLTEEEIAQLTYWVHRGANLQEKINSLDAGDSLRIMASASVGTNQSASTPSYDFPEASPRDIAKLQSPYRTISPLYREGPALQVSFFLANAFNLNLLMECKPVAQQVVSLNLARMPVTDQSLKQLSMFTNLERLDLSGTNIEGKTFEDLKPLKKLSFLSLTQTRVGLNELRKLKSMESLKKVWVWNTGIDSVGLAQLRKEIPHVKWETGINITATEKLKLTMPQPADPDKMIFSGDEKLALKHPLKGARIVFTTDGSDPDTINGNIFEKGIAVDRPLRVKARAVLDGWLASEANSFTVYARGYKPDSIHLLTDPNPRYKLNGGPSLMDGLKGSPENLLVNWLGYREDPFRAVVETNGKNKIEKIILSTAINHGAYVFPPQRILVKYGMEKGKWQHTKQFIPEQPTTYGPLAGQPYVIDLIAGSWKYFEIIVEPVEKLPGWHSGKNQKAWVFLDEIMLQ